MSCSSDGGRTFVPAYPVDISADGVGLISTAPLPSRFVVTLELDNKRIQASARCVSAQKGTLKGNIVWRIGARFIEIARESRALIERFIRRLPLVADPKPAGGIFPDPVIHRILGQLVELERLAPLRRGRQPLVKLSYAGLMRRGAQMLHSVKIESRVVHDGTTTVYATQAYISERLTRIEVVPLDNGRYEQPAAGLTADFRTMLAGVRPRREGAISVRR